METIRIAWASLFVALLPVTIEEALEIVDRAGADFARLNRLVDRIAAHHLRRAADYWA